MDLLQAALDAVVSDMIVCLQVTPTTACTCSSLCLQHRQPFFNAPLRGIMGVDKDTLCDGAILDVQSQSNDDKCIGKCVIKAPTRELIFKARGEKLYDRLYVFVLVECEDDVHPRPSPHPHTSDHHRHCDHCLNDDHDGEQEGEGDTIKELFYNSKLLLGTIEVDDSKGWHTIIQNTYNRHGELSDIIKTDKRAKEKIYKACKKSVKNGSLELVDIGGPYPFVRLHISFIGKSGSTYSRFSYIGVEREVLADLEHFFLNAPVLMGIVELSGDSCEPVYMNRLAKEKLKEFTRDSVSDSAGKGYHDVLGYFYKSLIDENPIQAELQLPLIDDSDGHFYGTMSCLSKSDDKSRHAFVFIDISTFTQHSTAMVEKLKECKNSLQSVRAQALELKESEEKFKSLVSSAPSIILTLDNNGIVQFANRVFQCGIQPVGKALHSLVHEGEELKAKFSRLVNLGQPFKIDVKLIHPRDIWLSVSVARANEKLSVLVATEVTEKKKLEQELHRVLQTKSRFLANMSHEIRTPLSGIIGMSRILADSGLTIDQADCVSTIQQCGETLLALINDVLDYTKLEATGELEVVKENFSLQQILEESLYTVLPTSQKKKIDLILDVEPGIPDWVVGDSMRLRQILVNLLNNSVKFTDSGYVLITISASPKDGLCFNFDIRIKDTGCGVQPDSQGKLFQMFSQVDSSTTRRFGGTGLGLALAKRFAEMMGGDITMESSGKDGEGSTFALKLPVFLASTSPPPSTFSAYSQSLFTTNTTVVIVDKCPISCRALQNRLQNKGFLSIRAVPTMGDLHADDLAQYNEVLVFATVDGVFEFPKLDLPRVAYIFMGSQLPDLPKSNSVEFPKIFEFARKPLKDSALCRCINSISLQFHSLESGDDSPRSPHPRTSKRRSNSFPVYPIGIMVVEDNEVNQRVIKKMLNHIGYCTVSIANNGLEALQIVERGPLPDLVFMDVQMPVLDGIECTRILRKTYPNNWPYIVSMTADAFPEDRANCLNAGMDDFLTKPIRLEQLQAALEVCYITKKIRFPTS